MTHPLHKRAAAFTAALAVGALALASAPAAASAAVASPAGARGHVTPAIGVHPAYHREKGSTKAGTTFACQTTTPATCYGPDQIRAAYGIDKLKQDGAGQTIVIVDAYSSPAIRDDLASFNSLFGLPTSKFNIIAPQGLTPFDQSNAEQVGWSGEITLDVEWAHAIAPKATIDLVLAKSSNDQDLENALVWVERRHLGTVVSQSYGEAEQCAAVDIRRENALFGAMNAHGTTVLASAGDQGAAEPSCDGSTWITAASTPASAPNVTGIGGTDLIANGITGAYQSETVWNEPEYQDAGGSGFSKYFAEPRFQRGAQHTGVRTVPDVSYNASVNQSVLTVWSESGLGAGLVFGFGGTSAGSPQWAGLVALAAQKAGHRLGNINGKLYSLLCKQHVFFHDITSGNTTTTQTNADGSDITITGVSAHPGFDFATGLGSPKADRLVPALSR